MNGGTKLRGKLTYANVMATIAVFIALGGGAYAAKQLPKNSVGSPQIRKNAVKTGDIARNAIRVGKLGPEAAKAGKIAKNAITTNRLRDNAVIGAKVNESTLGTVPNAADAGRADVSADAEKLGGRTAGELVTSTYSQRTSDALLTDQYQPVLDASVKTAGARIVATASAHMVGGSAAAQAECRLAIDSNTSSGFRQDIPLVGGDSDATLSFSFAAVVEAGAHAIEIACKEGEGNVEVIYTTLAAVAVGE